MISESMPVPGDLADRVSAESYARLLGYPAGRLAEGRAAELAADSRSWYKSQGGPWVWVGPVESIELRGEIVTVGGRRHYESPVLAERLDEIGADGLLTTMVSAGPEVDRATDRHWRAERPDEAYFLDRFGAAAAVHLGAWAAARLRTAARDHDLELGPGYSPGYDGWDLGDQVVVVGGLIDAVPSGAASLPAGLRVLESGMLKPKNSLVAVFGLTSERQAVEHQWARHACSWCSLSGCTLRGASP